MIEINKRKNEKIRGFLKWLEREIVAEFDNLANKTALKEYHEHDFNQTPRSLQKEQKQGIPVAA